MKNFNQSPLLLCILLVGLIVLFAAKPIDTAIIKRTHFIENTQEVRHIELSEGVDRSELISLLQQAFKLHPDLQLVDKNHAYRDKLNWEHQRVVQHIQETPIYGSSISLHQQNGKIEAVSGPLLGMLPFNTFTNSSFSTEDILAIAKECMGAKTYMWEVEAMEAFIKKEKNDPNATHFPVIEAVYFPNNYPKLGSTHLKAAYIIEVYAKEPLAKKELVIDAVTGAILFESSKIHHIDEPGTAQTAYSGQRDITTHRPNDTAPYELQNLTYGNGVKTFDCFDTDSYLNAAIPTSTSNDWDYPNQTADAILDAHWGGEQNYDYFQTTHNWSSFDNSGTAVNSYVHFSLVDFGFFSNVNAFWDGERLTFGDGNPGESSPLTCIDIYAHEFAHGVTEFSADLEYQDESGALNESFSDIFGACVEYYAKPEEFSWLNGNEIFSNGDAIRSMSDPNQFEDPDTYFGDFWQTGFGDNGGVHTNSGVQNYWFYLITDGGNGTNDNGDNFSVSPIGIQAAELIAFRTLTVYLNQFSNYDDARFFSIMSAEDIYGACSPEVIAVTDAWHAVGVGDVYNDAVSAAFQPSSNYACTIPATIAFTDNSSNGDSYLWDFGDGNTSTDPSPTHTYTDAGTYTVSLTLQGSTLCNSADTLTLANAITVDDSDGVVAANCIPTNPSLEAVIVSFDLLSINNGNDFTDVNYQDFSCDFYETVLEGTAYPMQISLNGAANISVWLDGNSDGGFTNNELTYQSTEASTFHSFNWIVPAVSTYDTGIRLRVANYITDDFCSTSEIGQVEDYAIVVTENTLPPDADFLSSLTVALTNEPILFQDQSLNAPTNWSWEFPGANITTSTDKNVSVSYPNLGTYDVTLIVFNQYGNDTLFIPDYINVVNTFDMCDISVTDSPSGIFYDPGGESGNYSNNAFCTLLISPACANSITLTFPFFNTENGYDYVRVYDGVNDSAPLLGSFAGTQDFPPLSSTGPEMFVLFDSDGSVTRPGFEIHWNADVFASEPFSLNVTTDNSNPALGETIQFFDGSADLANGWLWNFGDGNTSTIQNPTHSYLSSGPKTILLEAFNCDYTEYDTIYLDVQQSAEMSLLPESQSLSILDCGDAVTSSFVILNPGQGDLLLDFNGGSEPLSDSFEGGVINQDIWESVTGVVSNNCGVNTGNGALYFNDETNREAITNSFTLTANDSLSFYLKYGSGGGTCEEVDIDEHVEISYRVEGTTNWTTLESFEDLSNYYSFNQITILPTSDFVNTPTQFRINQPFQSGSGTDNWSIDDFEVKVSSAQMEFSPSSVNIAAGGSSIVSFTINRANRIEGMYDNSFLILTNILGLPIVSYPIDLTIEGEGILGFPQNCIVFDTIQEFTTNERDIVLYNSGCGIIAIESITASHPDFIINYTGNEIIPNDSLVINTVFSPQTYDDYSETLTITYDGGLQETICLEATSLGAPLISSNPEILELALIDCQDSIQGSVTLYNTGNGPLEFSLQSETVEDFENGLDFNMWDLSGGEVGNVPCGSNSGSFACYFYFDGTRALETSPINLSSQSTVSFFLKYGSGGSCEEVDFGEHIVLEYSINGFDWNIIGAYENLSDYYAFTEITEIIPIAAASPNTLLRWRQPSHSGFFSDYWAIDDIRYNGNSDSFILEAESGTITENDSLVIPFTYLRNNNVAGDYEETIIIPTNDPTQPTFELLVDITIEGDGELSMNTDCLALLPILENTTAVDSFMITNTGCAPLSLTNFSSSDGMVFISQVDVNLLPSDSLFVFLNHIPDLFGDYTGNIDFESDGVAVQKCFTRTVLPAAEITLAVESIDLVGNNCPDEVQGSIDFTNTGNEVLEWSLFTNSVVDFEEPIFDNDTWTSTGGENSDLCSPYNGQQSLRFFGSGQRAITSSPINVTAATNFEFYLKYGTGGGSDCELLNNGEGVTIQYSNNGIGNWTNIVTLNDIDAYENWNLVNIEIPEFLIGQQVGFRIIQFSNDGFATDIWLIDDLSLNAGNADFEFSPENGTAMIDDETTIDFTINTSDLNTGTYTYEIFVETNDPTQPQLVVPVSLQINGASDFTYNGPNCFDFGSVFNGITLVDSIFIENEGCAPLDVSSMIVPNPVYTVLSYSETTPQDTGSWIMLSFSPVTTGVYEETLSIVTSEGTESICISGEGLPAPAISVTPDELDINLNFCVETVETEVLIYNTGASTLTFNPTDVFNSDLTLDTLLNRWLENGSLLTDLVPNIYGFSGGEFGNNISDGGGDMYDGGNFLNTNFANSIGYTADIIQGNGEFGTAGQYFTSKIPSMFLMAADLDDVSGFSITGNLGADGSGTKESATLAYNSSLNETYTGYISRVYNSGDPSINHLIIVPTNDEIEVSIINGTGTENHQVANLDNTDRIYYILFATNGGNEFVSDVIFQNVFENFVEIMLPNLSGIVSVEVSEESVEPGDSTIVNLVFNTEELQPGSFEFVLSINSNDPNSPTVSIPVNVNAIEAPCTSFEYNQPNECAGTIQFTDVSPAEIDTWFWDFGDGNASIQQNPMHTYEESGSYEVVLTAGSNLLFSEYILTVDIDLSILNVSLNYTDPLEDGAVLFSGISEEGESWLWDFGDGTTSNSREVAHIYEQSGIYEVTLTTFDANGCSGTITESISYTAVGISSLPLTQIGVYPNPTQGVFSIQKKTTAGNMVVSLYDVKGQLIVAPFRLLDETTSVDIRQQPSGVYLMKVETETEVFYHKIVKQ